MTAKEKARWKSWADDLRQQMMTNLVPTSTKSVAAIIEESRTETSETILATPRFWKALQAGNGSNDVIAKAGFTIEFEPNADGKIKSVEFQLNETWNSILQQVLDRKSSNTLTRER